MGFSLFAKRKGALKNAPCSPPMLAAILIRRRANESHVHVIRMTFGMTHDGHPTPNAIGIFDERPELCSGIAMLKGMFIEEFLKIVIDEDVLDFLGFEKIFDDEPVFRDVEVRSIHFLESDEFLIIFIDVADIDVAPRLVRKMGGKTPTFFEREIANGKARSLRISGRIGFKGIHEESHGKRRSEVGILLSQDVASARLEFNAIDEVTAVRETVRRSRGAVKFALSKDDRLTRLELVRRFAYRRIVLL